jgi:hypothetical protein
MRFDTKIAIVVRSDLPTWQKLNMTAFLASGLAAAAEDIVGQPYVDGSDRVYLPMFRQPVLVFEATAEQLRAAYDRALARDVQVGIFTQQLFSTGHDDDNRAAVRSVASAELELAGLALHAARNTVDKVTKGLQLHT